MSIKDTEVEIVKHYSGDGVTVVWKPKLCIHSGICFRGMPGVFDPTRRPWVDLSKADATAVIEHVGKCPSGALSIEEHVATTPEGERVADAPGESVKPAATVEVRPGGPIVVKGWCEITANGETRVLEGKVASFCRCTLSKNMPYCDGSHREAQSKGVYIP